MLGQVVLWWWYAGMVVVYAGGVMGSVGVGAVGGPEYVMKKK